MSGSTKAALGVFLMMMSIITLSVTDNVFSSIAAFFAIFVGVAAMMNGAIQNEEF